MEKVKISVSPDVRIYRYLFSCSACKEDMAFITGPGRYGNTGEQTS